MARRFLKKLPRRTLQIVGAVLVLGVLVFFGLTRTEVGREQFKEQIETQFDERFAGQLQIGRLTGNLVGTVYARNVRLKSPSGEAVLQVDSVRAVPRWRSLFGQEVFFRTVELIRPSAHLERSSQGTWNLARTFHRTAPRDTSKRSPFALRFADIVMQNGAIRTENQGAAPRLVRKNWLFDYTRARLSNVDARFSLERTADEGLQIDLQRLQGRLAQQNLPIESARGQLVVSDETLAVRQLHLQVGKTQLDGTFSMDRADEATPPVVQLALEESRFAHDQIRRLVPRWPLHGTTTARLEARGPLDRLTLEQFRIERGASALYAQGTVRGLPEEIIFDLQFDESRLTAADLQAVLPGLPQQRLAQLARFGTLRFSLEAKGQLASLSGPDQRLRASAQFDVQSDAGRVQGTADLSRQPGQRVTYSADVRAEDFEADRFADTPAFPSQLTGTLNLSGEGISTNVLAGSLEVQLDRSVVAGRRLEKLDVDLRTIDDGQLTGTATLRQQRGEVRLRGTADLSGSVPAYDLIARGKRFDLGALLNRDSLSTALTGTARLHGQGVSLGTLAGRLRLALDSSTVTRGETTRSLPALTSTVQLAAPGEEGPRIRLRSDVADLTVNGEADLAVLQSLGQLWGRSFAEAFQKAYHKPYPARAVPPPEEQSSSFPERQRTVRHTLETAGIGEALDLQAEFTLKRPAVIQAFLPAFPSTRHDTLALQMGLQAGPETLSLSGQLQTEALRTERLHATRVESQFRVDASLTAPLLQTLDASFDASADTLGIGGARFHAPALAMSYREREGDVQLATSAAGGSGRLQLGAGLRLLPDRNRLRVRTLRLTSGDYQWRNAETSPIDLYADAIDVPGLTLINRGEPGLPPRLDRPEASQAQRGTAQTTPRSRPPARLQRLRVHGTLSSTPTDTLFADASQVRLRPISQVAGLKRPIGGRLDAQMAWTGGARRPKLIGRLGVSRLSFDDRLLGHFSVTSRYVTGTPRVAFEAQLRPPPQDGRLRVESRRLQPEENRIAARGTVALPGLGPAEGKAGTFDLQLDIKRADLFFFDYLFDGKIANASGAVTGTGHVSGTFQDPLFQADLEVNDGSFRIPRFGLRYAAEGDVSVDREGIKIEEARVTDPDGGRATIQGALLFNNYEYFSFDLSASLDELQIIDVASSPDLPFYGEIAASGPVQLTGPLSDARLTSNRVRTTADSELILPIEEDDVEESESGFLIFADSTGRLPDLRKVTRRENILDDRPAGERSFVDGLDLDLGISAPQGSTVRLVFDPLLGDEIEAVGGGQIQLLREEGDLSLYGTFDVNSGRYLFTAGQVFQRRFQIEEGTLRWDGPPANARLDLTAAYRTRASRAGLPGTSENETERIPLIVRLQIDGRVQQPSVDLSLAVDQEQRGFSDYSTAGLETVLNRDDRESEYATSVLLTNTFLLTTDLAGRQGERGLSETGNRLAFNSVSQLVSSQLNRYLDEALPGLNVNLGVQGENPQDLDVIYGVALRLLNERLVIRGEGILEDEYESENQNGFEGEFVVEVRLTPRVSAEAFYRREGSLLSERALTSTTGAGLSYQTEFPTWKRLWYRLFGWLGAGPDERPPEEEETVAAGEGT